RLHKIKSLFSLFLIGIFVNRLIGLNKLILIASHIRGYVGQDSVNGLLKTYIECRAFENL
ncbi:MAG: hypothetical protein WBP96_00145, partial [Nitrososphaeraceae archaeon]